MFVAGLAPGPDLVPGLGPVGVATALAPVAVAMTGKFSSVPSDHARCSYLISYWLNVKCKT